MLFYLFQLDFEHSFLSSINFNFHSRKLNEKPSSSPPNAGDWIICRETFMPYFAPHRVLFLLQKCATVHRCQAQTFDAWLSLRAQQKFHRSTGKNQIPVFITACIYPNKGLIPGWNQTITNYQINIHLSIKAWIFLAFQ